MSTGTGAQQKINDEKGRDVRTGNILAARAVADTVRTSLGPKGMDKMIQDGRGEVLITNDGATILQQMKLAHPTAKMLVELSKAQDIEAGDGTTSVVVIAGSLLQAAEKLLAKGVHPQTITEAFLRASDEAEQILTSVAIPVDLKDRQQLIKTAKTSLNSKVVSQSSDLLAPMAVDSVLRLIGDDSDATSVDLKDVHIVKKLGGTVDDCELVEGLVLSQKIAHIAGGPTNIKDAKIGLIQFCLSAPKTDMESNVQVRDYTQMDRLLREERTITAKMVKQIKATGCNVLLIQKSILRDAVTTLSLDFCAKAKIMVVKDIERDDIEFISKMIGLEPVASLDAFTADKLGVAASVVEQTMGEQGSLVRFTGLTQTAGGCVSVLVRASNALLLDEVERSFHDALCVVRSLVKKKAIMAGGGAPEMEVAQKLSVKARSVGGMDAFCMEHFAEALELVPYTLAENAGLIPVEIVTKLRAAHTAGETYAGINVKKGTVTNMMEDNVIQPLLVSTSAIKMATETVRMILKIDDIVPTM